MNMVKKLFSRKPTKLILIILGLIAFLALAYFGGRELYLAYWPLGKLPAQDWNAKNLEKINNSNINPDNFCFAVFGDNRDNDEVLIKILNEVENDPEISFSIHLGDMVHHGRKSEYCNFMSLLQKYLHKPLLMVVGNHDIRGRGSRFYRKIFGPLYYSFEIGHIAFIAADTSLSKKLNKTQLQWLDETLSKSENKQILVFGHQPLSDPRGDLYLHCLSPEASEKLVSLFRKYKVSHVFSGHIHSYFQGRWQGIPYTITAGAGAPLAGDSSDHYFYHYIKVRVSLQHISLELVRISQ